MTETRPDPRTEPEVDAVGRLLSLTGPRPELSPEAVLRLKSAVRPHWRVSVRKNAWWAWCRRLR